MKFLVWLFIAPTPGGFAREDARAEVVSLKGDSYRLKDRDLGCVPTATKTSD
jgi:hypothetical protein